MFYNLLYPLTEHVPLFNLFQYLTVRAGGAMVTAFVLSLLVGPWLIQKFRTLQVHFKTVRENLPENHAATKTGTPSMGGVLIWGTLMGSVLLWGDWKNAYLWLTIAAVTGFGLIGFADDFLKMTQIRKGGVPGKVRLLCGGLIAAAAIYIFGEVLDTPRAYDVFIPFLKDVVIPLGTCGYILFGTLVIVGAANAVNLTDGLDGLASGTSVIAAGSFALIAYIVGRVDFTEYLFVHYVPGAGELMVFCAALAGACLGFLWFNAPPARIFMGDTGSLVLGSSLGMVAVITKHEIVLAIIGGVFVIEALSVMLQVASFKLRKKRIFRMAPLHHHYEKAGLPESTIVVRAWIIAFFFALVGLASFKLR